VIAEFLGDELERKQQRARRPAFGGVVFEPRAAEIRETMFGTGEQTSQQSEDPTVRHHEDASTTVVADDVGERGHGPGLRGFGGFETRRTTIGLEPTGPLRLDLLSGQSLPLAGVVLAPTSVDAAVGAAEYLGEQIGGHRGAFEVTGDHEIERWAFRGQKRACLASLQTTEGGERRVGLPLPFAESIPFTLSVTHDENTGDVASGVTSDVVRVGGGHGRSRYPRYARPVVTLRLFAQAREAAGTSRDEMPGSTVEEVVRAAGEKYGDRFTSLLPTCRVWLNGEEVPPTTPVTDKDEVAVLPPVSGGCR
jgi:molybdopterin synthase sulfur carrier subunit